VWSVAGAKEGPKVWGIGAGAAVTKGHKNVVCLARIAGDSTQRDGPEDLPFLDEPIHDGDDPRSWATFPRCRTLDVEQANRIAPGVGT
jgi:hypothetical protein